MLTVIAENYKGEKIQLTDSIYGDVINITGLNPSKADLIFTDLAGMDGSRYNSGRRTRRNIVITLAYKPPIEENRNIIYRYFPTNTAVRLHFKTDSRSVYIDGYVEANEVTLFTNKEQSQISIICGDPYFKSADAINVNFSNTISLFEFPFNIDKLFFSAEGAKIETSSPNSAGKNSLTIYEKSTQDGTPSPDNPIEVKSVGDSGNLEITACGNQLANLPDIETNNNGITWICVNGVVTVKGTSTFISTSSNFLAYYMPTGTAGTFYVSGGNNKITVYMYIKRANGATEYIYNKSFTLDGTEQIVRLYMQIEAGVTVDDTIYPMLNVGNKALPFEAYKGNTAIITTALPLCSVGDVCDELVYNSDGTAKIIKRTYLIDNLALSYTGANCNIYSATSPYTLVNSSGKCTHTDIYLYSGEDKEHYFTYDTAVRVYLPKEHNVNASDIKLIAVLKTPQEIPLTADEAAQIESLFTLYNAQGIEFSEILQASSVAINAGDISTGAIFTLTARTSQILNPRIYNTTTNEYFGLNVDLMQGDVITISTYKGSKSALLNHDGEITNVINKRQAGSKWLQLAAGVNEISYSCDEGKSNLDVKINSTACFEGL